VAVAVVEGGPSGCTLKASIFLFVAAFFLSASQRGRVSDDCDTLRVSGVGRDAEDDFSGGLLYEMSFKVQFVGTAAESAGVCSRRDRQEINCVTAPIAVG
jgi:hypothetical protein